MPKVSVIVPVYGVEKYVSKCIESVLNQTYSDWELILVDDGSPDRSGAICDEYAQKDCRIKVIHKENGGVSSARNKGLDNATGEWVTFLDSDDYLQSDTLQSLFDAVETYPMADLIDYPILRDAGSEDGEKLDAVKTTTVITSIRDIERYWYLNPRFESCSRLYKREKLEDIRFDPSMRIGEDTVFFMHYLMRCDTIVAIPNGLYAYCYRKSSAMGTAQKDKLVTNELSMLELMGEKVWKRSILAAILYRMIIPKLQENKIAFRDVVCYKQYLDKIGVSNLIQSSLPFKAKIIVLIMKIMVIKGSYGNE